MINDMYHRFAIGHMTEKALLDGNFLVVDFPTQDDQNPFRSPWGVSTISEFADYQDRIRSLDGFLNKKGNASFKLVFSVLTPAMFAYLESLMGGESSNATLLIPVKFRQPNSLWVAYTGIIDLPDRKTLTLESGMYYTNVPFQVTRASRAVLGVGFSIGFSGGFDS